MATHYLLFLVLGTRVTGSPQELALFDLRSGKKERDLISDYSGKVKGIISAQFEEDSDASSFLVTAYDGSVPLVFSQLSLPTERACVSCHVVRALCVCGVSCGVWCVVCGVWCVVWCMCAARSTYVYDWDSLELQREVPGGGYDVSFRRGIVALATSRGAHIADAHSSRSGFLEASGLGKNSCLVGMRG
jgi:hypothetical protein